LRTSLEARVCTERLGELGDALWVESQANRLREIPNSLPTLATAGEHFRTAEKGDFAVAEFVEMFEGSRGAHFIVDRNGAAQFGFDFASGYDRGNLAFREIAEEFNVRDQPVGNDDEAFDAAVEKHFEIALEAVRFVVGVGEEGKIVGLVEGVFEAAKNRSAKRIGDIKNHDANDVGALAAQGASERIGTITEALGHDFDARFGVGRDIA
jgi:hypothetical protein